MSEVPWSNAGQEEPRPVALLKAAAWLGHFHSICEDPRARHSFGFLNTYDDEYFRSWTRRTLQFACPIYRRVPWLAVVCEAIDETVLPILRSPKVVIHGEYYPMNILLRCGTVFPVDWESAALAIGEIDLASLTDGWPAATVQDCVAEYVGARWPHGEPADFERKYSAAQLYWCLRWLGDQRDWTLDQSMLPYFERLRISAERLGLI
jgi:aminoglycoside phosphotransferase (APT) family kinase protein